MSNVLVEELFRKLATLQADNDKLKEEARVFERTKEEICRLTTFKSWDMFVEWIRREKQFGGSQDHESKKQNIQQSGNEEPHLYPINSIVSFCKKNQFCQSFTDRQSSIKSEEGIPLLDVPETVRWESSEVTNFDKTLIQKNTQKISKNIHSHSTYPQRSQQIQTIILQNSKLRKKVSLLKQTVESYKRNLYSLASLLPCDSLQKLQSTPHPPQQISKRTY